MDLHAPAPSKWTDTPAPRFVMPDVDAFAELIRHQGAEVVRCEPTREADVIHLLQLPDMLLRLGQQHTQWTCMAETLPGHLSFVVPFDVRAGTRFNGVPMRFGLLPFYGSSMEHISTTQETEFLYISIPERLILSQLVSLCGGFPEYSGDICVSAPGPAGMRVLRELVYRMIGTVRAQAEAADPCMLMTMQNELVDLLAQLASAGLRAGEHPIAPAQRRRAFSMALAYARDTLGTAPQLADLCAVSGVCERTLRSLFMEFTGQPPARFLHRLRLHRVRGLLLHSAPSGMSVKRAALDNGFWDFGHFALQYRALFGERPSETLAFIGTPELGHAEVE